MTAASGLAPLKADYDAGGSGKDLFGLIDIGLNPGINVPLATGAVVWPQAGAVTVVLGNDLFAGGSNNSDFAYAGQLGGASVTVDDKVGVENGRLKEPQGGPTRMLERGARPPGAPAPTTR